MALDIEDKLYDAVAAMESDATWATYAAADRPKFVLDSGYYSRAKRTIWRGLADYPQIRIESHGTVTLAQTGSTPQTFMMNRQTYTPAQCDVPMPGQFRIGIVAIHRDVQPLEKQAPLETAIRAFLLTRYPTLRVTDDAGRTFVTNFGVTGTRRNEQNEDTKRVMRTVARLTINVNVRVYLSQLVA